MTSHTESCQGTRSTVKPPSLSDCSGKARPLCLACQAFCFARLLRAPPPRLGPALQCWGSRTGLSQPALSCFLFPSKKFVPGHKLCGPARLCVSVSKHNLKTHFSLLVNTVSNNTSKLQKAAGTMVPCPCSKPKGHHLL